MNVVMDCRTVSIVKPLTVEQRNGINGSFESKEVLFKIAVDRDYKVTRMVNGKPEQSNPTDFFLAKAVGNTAQAFADYCTAKKEDGKLVSRQLLLTGHFETYQKDRPVTQTVAVNLGGQMYNVDVTLSVTETNYIFIVDKMKFLDYKPQGAQTGTTQAVVVGTPVPVGTPAQNTVAQVPVAPAVPTAPVAPATAVQNAVTQVAQDMANAMNPPVAPVVDPNFTPAGNVSPF